ncbi:type VII secretion-associated serine protease mycosin [Streptomyces sp. 7-21]|jgi:membrane-anchored mycosin MYCP|uniref:type VII secretion-associated serine protease mycosin n=1 Tax=Streptomyces sp. 7-21 TaxID=2802283 RepID=UPI00191EADC4|nr:type VII secretion-associated serine protease mycosin [Streptomyces sp. 7-21]MBL1068307.1 type VII secretion-associated serine protease mycosin [Streptomyces sp. 7-21]
MKRRSSAGAVATALALAAALAVVPAAPARADAAGTCTFPAEPIEERPWSLQRLLLDELWRDTRGEGVDVAVIDSGVDTANPQLAEAVDASRGADFTPAEPGPDATPPSRSRGDGTTDTVGHGTKVAGIIAARPADGSGFVGIAPGATIIPIRQNDEYGSGTVSSLARSVDHAVAEGADIINISQDSEQPPAEDSELARAIADAVAQDVLVIASVGNEGADGRERETYPAAYDGVLAVAASDRNNERAPFSQSGDFVDIAAPGVDMVSTVPGGGQCVDHGTSFAAPYVAGVAALLRAKHPDWSAEQVATHLMQTAERAIPGADAELGWGVVDPVRALTDDTAVPGTAPTPDAAVPPGPAPDVPPLTVGETHAERDERLGTYALVTTVLAAATLAGAALVVRDARRRRAAAGGTAPAGRTGGPGGTAAP